jgi:ABC-type branched-subunit amino acid transport system substrate-binding protein
MVRDRKEGMMKRISVFILAMLGIAILLSTLAVGCASEEETEEETTTVVVGRLTDLTGPAAFSLVNIGRAVTDIVNYINEEDPLAPGVKLKVISYDTKYDPSRDVPGYEWLKEKGACMFITPLSSTGEALKTRLASDKLPLLNLSTSFAQIDPPGWRFGLNLPNEYNIAALTEWLVENWAGSEKVKMGSVGWNHPYGITTDTGARVYAQSHTDDIEWIGSYLSPMGTMTWSTEIEALKDADYVFICAPGIAPATFMDEYRGRGYAGTFVGSDSMSSYVSMYVDQVGWEDLDGTLTAQAMGWYSRDSEVVDLCNQLLDANNTAADAAVQRANGISYVGGFQQYYLAFAVLRKAVETYGANVTGQQIYDTALSFDIEWEGYPTLGYTEDRFTPAHTTVYEWVAAEQDLMLVQDWLPGIRIDVSS